MADTWNTGEAAPKVSARKAWAVLGAVAAVAVVLGAANAIFGGGTSTPADPSGDILLSGTADAGYVVAHRPGSGWDCRVGGLRISCTRAGYEAKDQGVAEPGSMDKYDMFNRFKPFTGTLVRYDPAAWTCRQPSTTEISCTAD